MPAVCRFKFPEGLDREIIETQLALAVIAGDDTLQGGGKPRASGLDFHQSRIGTTAVTRCRSYERAAAVFAFGLGGLSGWVPRLPSGD